MKQYYKEKEKKLIFFLKNTKLILKNVQSNGGRPNNSGLKSLMDPSTRVASFVRSLFKFSSGIMITCIPAFSDAFTPLGASSNTRH